MIPTPEQFLAKLAANPADGAAFDHSRPNMSRRAHVEAVLNAVRATTAETQALKSRLAASRAKIAAIATATKSQTSIMKTPPSPPTPATAAPAVKLTTAADFQKSIAPPTMKRSEFSKLTNSERNQWIRGGGTLV